MASPNKRPADVEVEDPAAAFRKFEDFGRRILAVPKTKLRKEPSKQKRTSKKGSR
jgi:hypothetical protein